jgi:hypothetical protein
LLKKAKDNAMSSLQRLFFIENIKNSNTDKIVSFQVVRKGEPADKTNKDSYKVH